MLIGATFRDVYNMCHKHVKGSIFGAIWDPKISKNSPLWSFSPKVSLSFTLVLLHMFIASTFRCVENMASGAQFWVTLGPKYVKIPTFGHCLIFSTGFASVLVYMSIWFSFRGVEYRPQRPTFRVILGHEIDHNSGLPSFSKIFSTGFTSFWFYMFIGGTFRCISMMCPKGPISGPRVKVIAVIT